MGTNTLRLVSEYYQAAYSAHDPGPTASRPQFPYVGQQYDRAPLRVVFVGKAPAGWGRGADSEYRDWSPGQWARGGAEATAGFLETVIGRSYRSAWWDCLARLAASLAPGSGGLRGVACTNLFKAGTGAGNPNGRLRSYLLGEPRVGWLRSELEILRPDVIVFFCRSYRAELSRMLPGVDLSPSGDRPWAAGRWRGASVFLARHPQGWRVGGPGGLDAFEAAVLVGAARA